MMRLVKCAAGSRSPGSRQRIDDRDRRPDRRSRGCPRQGHVREGWCRDLVLPVKAVLFDIGGAGHSSDAMAIWLHRTATCVSRTRAASAWMEGRDYLPTARRRGDEQHHRQALRRPLDRRRVRVRYSYQEYRSRCHDDAHRSARRVFPRCWFNESTTEAGRDALGYYHERQDEKRSIGLGPEHDWSSHAADAFGIWQLLTRSRR